MKEHVIWSNYYEYMEEMAKDISENEDKEDWMESNCDDYYDDDFDESEYDDEWKEHCLDMAYDWNNDYLYDERVNLKIDVHSPIIMIGDLGLWDGRVKGYKEMKTSVISDCMYSDCDYVKWYCDAHDFRSTETHHDGTNYILYRMRKETISDAQWESFLYKIYKGVVTRKDITRYTKSLMPYIANVYGWKYRDYSKERKVA